MKQVSELLVAVSNGRNSYNLLETNGKILLVAERKFLSDFAYRQTAIVEIYLGVLDFSFEEVVVRRNAEFLLENVYDMVFGIIELRAKTFERKFLLDHHVESILYLHGKAVLGRGGIAPDGGKYLKKFDGYAVREFFIVVLVVFEIIENIFEITTYITIGEKIGIFGKIKFDHLFHEFSFEDNPDFVPTVFLAGRILMIAPFFEEEHIARLRIISLSVDFQHAFARYNVFERHDFRILSLVVDAVFFLSLADYSYVHGRLFVDKMREVDKKFCHNPIRPILLIIVIFFYTY